MVSVHKPELEGNKFQYNKSTWELTGDLDIRQNGELIVATAKKSDRVRGNKGNFQFILQNPPASLNPGNPEEFDAELSRSSAALFLTVTRNHATNQYKLENMSYS